MASTLSFFVGYCAVMNDEEILTAVELKLQEKFKMGETGKRSLPSTATPPPPDRRLDSLILPRDVRPKMPLTQDKYVVKENPHLVEWEQTVREFLRKLSPEHEHRVSAVMVFEWATGVEVAALMEQSPERQAGGRKSWRADLRAINKVLTFYFGTPYRTWIGGRKVHKAYKVRKGYYIRRHRPMTLTLWVKYREGVLYP